MMYPRLILGGFAAFIIQTSVLFVGWELATWGARYIGRHPGDIFFGITINSGLILYVFLSILTTIGGIALRNTGESLLIVCACLSGWILWLLPSLSSRPYALPVFIALGSVPMIAISGFFLPRWSQDRRKDILVL